MMVGSLAQRVGGILKISQVDLMELMKEKYTGKRCIPIPSHKIPVIKKRVILMLLCFLPTWLIRGIIKLQRINIIFL